MLGAIEELNIRASKFDAEFREMNDRINSIETQLSVDRDSRESAAS